MYFFFVFSFFFFFFFVVDDYAYLIRVMSLHLLFGRPRDLLPAGILSLEILSNLSASILVTSLSHSLILFAHFLIGYIQQYSLICWLLILFCLANYFS